MHSFAVHAYEAENIHGYAHTLSPISAPGQWKVEQNIADGVVYISQDGGAWVPLGGGGGGGTLDADYQNGPAGNTILMTDALGPIALSSAITSGPILSITTTAAAPVAATVTGIAIDMSSLGTVASPTTVNVPAITIVGARSSVAKAAGSALVSILSSYSAASALSVRLRNKQALTGSAVVIGWDSTNYEGAVAASILTGQTHALTIDAYTNVDASANNVEVVGVHIVMPTTTNASAYGFSVDSKQEGGYGGSINVAPASPSSTVGGFIVTVSANANGRGVVFTHNSSLASTTVVALRLTGSAEGTGLELSDGQALNVSAASEGRLRYNASTQTFQVSQNGAAYVNIINTGTLTLQGAYDGGNTILLVNTSPIAISATGVLGAAFTAMSIDASALTAGAFQSTGFSVSMPASSSTSTVGVKVLTLQTAGTHISTSYSAGTTFAGTTVGALIDLDTNVTSAANLAVQGLNVVVGGGNTAGTDPSSASYCAKFDFRNVNGTTAGNGIVNVECGAPRTLEAPITGIECDLLTKITPGNFAITGLKISTAAGTRGAVAGEGALVIDSRNTGQTVIDCGARNTTAGKGLIYVHYTAATTIVNTTYGVYIDYQNNLSPSGATILPLFVILNTGGSSSTCAKFDYRAPAGTVAGNGIVNIEVGSSVTFTGPVTGLECDLSTNVTATARSVTGHRVLLPATTSGTFRGMDITTVGGASDVATSAGLYILSGASRNGAAAIRVDAAPTSAQTTFGPKALLIQTTNNNWVDGNFCEITNSSTGVNAAWNLLQLTVSPAGMTANAQMRTLVSAYSPTYTSGTFAIGTLNNLLTCTPTWNSAGTGTSTATVMGLGNAPARSAGTLNLADTVLSIYHLPTGMIGTDTSTLMLGQTSSKSGTVLDFRTTGTLTGTLNYLSIDASGATAGAQVVAGVYVKLPASSNASTSGVWVSTVSTSGRFYNGDFTISTTLSSTFVGCEIDCQTNVAAGTTQAILGARFRIADSSSVSTVGVQVDTTQTGSTSAAVKLNLTPASGAPSGVIVSMGANVSKTGLTDGSAFLATLVGAASCGLCINASVSTSAFGQNAIQARREMTTSTGMTDSTTFVELINTSTYNGGTTTISQSNVLSAMLATIAGATWTWSGNLLYVQSAPTRNSGTVTLSGKLANLTHAPSGTISADTTTGLYVSMTTTGAAVGAQITMSAGTTGPALSITHNGTSSNQDQLVFTAATDGTGAHLRGPTGADFIYTAGIRTGTGAGRSLRFTAGDGSTTGAGGDISLNEGAGAGGSDRGTVNIVSSTTGKLSFFNTGLAAIQKTPTGSRGGNAALASLLTVLSEYGLIVDGTSA